MKNKLIETPIRQLMDKLSSFSFVKNDDNKDYIETYLGKIESMGNDLSYLGHLEVLIQQINATKFTIDDIMLFPVSIGINTYINARVGFIRPNTKSETIRIVLGNVKEIGDNLVLIKKNSELMEKTYNTLLSKMNNEIILTKEKLNEFNFCRTSNS